MQNCSSVIFFDLFENKARSSFIGFTHFIQNSVLRCIFNKICNVNFNKNTSESAVLNKMCKPDERAPSFIFKQNFEMLCQTSSSVAAGGLSPPIGLKSMQNTTFLVLLRRIFAPKMKIAPPHGIGDQKL